MLKKLVGMSGALALAQLVNFIAISYGSKIFGAEEFGRYSFVNSLSLAISVVFYLKADNVILLESKNNISQTLHFIGRYSVFLLIVIFFAFLMLSIAIYDNEMFFLTALGVLLAYVNSKFIIYGSALIKTDNILKYSVTTVVRPAFMLCGQYLIYYFPKITYPMVLVRVLSEIIASIARKGNYKKQEILHCSVRDFVFNKKEYFVYGTVASLINSLSQQVPMIALPLKYGYTELAYFSLAFALTVAPLTLILSPLRSLLLKKLPSTDNQFVLRCTLLLLVPSIFIILIFSVSSVYVIDIFWDSTWSSTADYMRWISFWIASGLLSSPSYCYLIFSARQKSLVNIEGLFLLFKMIVILLTCLFSIEINNAVLMFVILGVLYNCVLIFYSLGVLSRDTA